jgi:hypothetical protein
MYQGKASMAEADVRTVLAESWPEETWTLARPEQGWRKESWIACSAQRTVFVAFDVHAAPLVRLSELGVAPPVLRHGRSADQEWVVQQWIDGHSPDRDWIRTHAAQAGALFGLVHADAPLRRLLAAHDERSPQVAFESELRHLRARVGKRNEPWFLTANVESAMTTFFAQAMDFQPSYLVPTHDEPNTSNMLVQGDRLWVLDWDDIVLADAYRDAGPLAWWYFPEHEREAVLRPMGLDLDRGRRAKLHWYAARMSLSVALWHAEQGHADDQGFLSDFRAAVRGEPNPRGKW